MPLVLLLDHLVLFFFNDPAPPQIYTLSLHDALPIYLPGLDAEAAHFDLLVQAAEEVSRPSGRCRTRSEEHTSELQSLAYLVCRLLLEKKKKKASPHFSHDDAYDDVCHPSPPYRLHQV